MDSTIDAATSGNGAKLPHTRFLRPPWPKGVSGNPSGLTKEGLPTKDAPFRRLLHAKAKRRRELQRLVNALWETACAVDNPGAGKARDQILERLDPILEDSAAGRQILTGLRLELKVGEGPVVAVRGAMAQAERRENESPGLLVGGSPAAETHPTAEVSNTAQENQGVPEATQESQGPTGS